MIRTATLAPSPAASSAACCVPARSPRARLAGVWTRLLAVWMGMVCCLVSSAGAATLPAGFVESDVFGYWPEIAGITFDSTGVMYAWERSGRVWAVENDVKITTPLLDISEEVAAHDDHGLLGFTLDPNFRQNGYLYLLYVVDHHHLTKFGTANYNSSSNEYNQATIGRITRYTARASDNFRSVDPASRTILVGETISTGFPMVFITHGLGTLVFGTDGTLMASCGDGANLADLGNDPISYFAQALAEGIIKPKENVGAYRAQLVDSLNGKIIRIDPATGNALPSNPFYDATKPRSARSRVWALGLRNPFRIALKPGTGSHLPADGNPGVLYIGDVGFDTWEELSIATRGGLNFGWPVYEGYGLGLAGAPANLDAPNPLNGIAGCSSPYFTFRELLIEDTLLPLSWPNPCNPAQQIPATIPRFMHTRPVMDWQHGPVGPSRAGTFNNGVATAVSIGTAGAPVSGPQFGGNCSIGGFFYQGTNLPASYQNKYFHVDLDAQWIKTTTFGADDNLLDVQDFGSGAGSIVSMAVHPLTGKIYYALFYDGVRKITYLGNGNQPPTAVASANKGYGTTPLTVQFTGSTSIDPEAQPLTYSWNFGDGTATSTAANPSHVFNAPAGVPTKFTVTLTVTDSTAQSSSTNLIVSLNNTPPVVTLTSPAAGALYSMNGETVYNLAAHVTDAQHTDAQLSYQWQTILHHNNHEHPNPFDTNHVTTSVVSPIGCDGNLYYYRFILTVTDPAGLFATAEVDLYPDCTGNTPPTISDIANQTVAFNQPTAAIPFTVRDIETPATGLIVTASSSNPALASGGNIVFVGTSTNRTLTITPVAGQFGTSTITVTVSDGSLIASDSFVLTVNPPANSPPTITGISSTIIPEDGATTALPFTVGDAETAAASLNVSAASSNPSLVPQSGLVLGGSGANRSITVTPAADQSGIATISVTVSDGISSRSTNFTLTVSAVNDTPTISNLLDQSIKQETVTSNLTFTVSDIETAAASLAVSAASSNPTLVPVANIVFGGNGANRIVTVTPAGGQFGSAVITVTVSDGALTASDTFLLTVTPTPPTYLLTEGFEGAGYENTGWTETGTPNADYTALPLQGAQALNCVGNQHIVRAFQFASSFNLYFRVRWIAWSPYNNVLYWDDSSYGTAAVLYANDNRFQLIHGSATANGTTILTTNTTYHVWVEWTKGTGANGTMKLYVSATGTKPASPEASLTAGTGAATERLYVGPTAAGPNVIFDRLLLDDVPVGNVLDPNQAPTVSDIANQSIEQNTSTAALTFTVNDAETAAASLVVTGSSSNPALVPNTGIVFGGSGANRTVRVTPIVGQKGTATISVTVSDGTLTATDTFLLTVNAVNLPPTISNLADQTISEDGGTGALNFSVNDLETPAANLVVTGASSNPALVPNARIVFGGSGGLRNVSIAPLPNQFGTATITVTVSDGLLTASDTFQLTVLGVNDAPSISSVTNQTVNEDVALTALPFTVGDLETPAASLTLTASSSHPALIPNGNIVFGGSGSYRTVTITPGTNLSGTATISLVVSDGQLTATSSFALTVNAVNDPPSVSAIPNQTTLQNTAIPPLPFTVGDLESGATGLTLGWSSSNPVLIPNSRIVLGGSGSNRTVTLSPVSNRTGTASITLAVSDGMQTVSEVFMLTVNALNTAPTISDLVNQTISEDTSTTALPFTIADTSTPAASLLLSASSSNPALIPVGSIVFVGSASNRTVTVTPATNQSGSATITVTVSDGALTASDTFLVTVNPVNDAPTISDIANQTIAQGSSTTALNFTIGDVETAAGGLSVSVTSSNPTLVPNGGILLGGSGANRNVTVTPAADQSGVATITVTVSDGAATATDTFTVTVNSTVASYLLSEGFEGTGYENTGWTETGAPNEDYTATALDGTQSLNCSGAQSIIRTFQNSTNFNLYCRVRWITWRDYANIIYWDNVSFGAAAALYAGDNRIQLVHGTATATGTTAITTNVTYHVWMEWTKGSGSNGTMKLFISTNGIKPLTPEAILTNGNGAATERIYVGPTATGPNVIFDRLLLDDATIGGNP